MLCRFLFAQNKVIIVVCQQQRVKNETNENYVTYYERFLSARRLLCGNETLQKKSQMISLEPAFQLTQARSLSLFVLVNAIFVHTEKKSCLLFGDFWFLEVANRRSFKCQ